MIYTITMNPALEFASEVTDFKFDKNNISDFDLMLPVRRGISISRILEQLGFPTAATGFAGGFTGEFVEGWLRREDIKSKFIGIDDSTRINIKITGTTKTVIESKGPSISHQKLQKLLYYLSGIREGGTVFLSMAFPRNITETVVERMIAVCKANKTQFVLDIDEYYLEEFADEGSPLRNIGVKCLEYLFKTEINSESDLLKWKNEILCLDLEFIIVPFVENKVHLFQKDSIYASEIDEIANQKRGFAIDSMIARFIATFIRTSDYEESFKMVNACAQASLKTKDLPKEFRIDDRFDDINIVKID